MAKIWIQQKKLNKKQWIKNIFENFMIFIDFLKLNNTLKDLKRDDILKYVYKK